MGMWHHIVSCLIVLCPFINKMISEIMESKSQICQGLLSRDKTVKKLSPKWTHLLLKFWTILWGQIQKPNQIENCTNATIVTLPLPGHMLWKHILGSTLEKKPTNVINAIMYLFRQALWGNISKLTQKKGFTNATSTALPLLRQRLWGPIWKIILAKSCTNANYVIMQQFL